MDDSQPKDLLALVWVHGFKGTDVTFEEFPARVTKILEDTHPLLRVESHVFPSYETKGELGAATEKFVEWLTEKVVTLENNHGQGRGAGSAKVVLCGHSMGGLLIADAVQSIARITRDGDPLWPNVVSVLAFDTPYLGLHPHVFKHHLSQAAGHVETARNIASNIAMLSPFALGLGFGKAGKSTKFPTDDSPAPSRVATPPASEQASRSAPKSDTGALITSDEPPQTPSKSWWGSVPVPSTSVMYGLGALAIGAAAAGTAYYRREDFATGWKWGFDHMTFVKNLWDEDGMRERLAGIEELSRQQNLSFANFYTYLPPNSQHMGGRTFAILPPNTLATADKWRPVPNSLASDEVNAHMYMFNARTNDGFYDLGLSVARVVAERIEQEGVRVAGES